MIQPIDKKYNIPEDLIDSILIHQKDKILSLLIQLEICEDLVTFNGLFNQAIGAMAIVADMWNVFGYSYKAKELDGIVQRIKRNHELGELMK